MAFRGTVLLVSPFDDRTMYAEYFRTQNLHVLEAASPDEALHQIADERPDVVVSDFVFGRMDLDGPTVIRILRAAVDDMTSLIVISGYIRREDRAQARSAGADAFLAKPALPRDVLYEVLRALIARYNGRRLVWYGIQDTVSEEITPLTHERRVAQMKLPTLAES